MTLAELWIVLRGRWRSALAVSFCLLSLVVAGSAAMWFYAPRYTASAAVVLDVKSPDPIAGMVLPVNSVSSYMATQADVLRSERVALRVIDALKLDQEAEVREDWMDDTEGRGDFRAWLAEAIARKLDARPGRESNVIAVKYTAKDPERASRIANAFVDAFVEVTLNLRVEPAKQYNAFFDERLRQLRDNLEAAQQKLSAYQRAHGIIANDERFDVENQRLAELTTQMVLLQSAVSDTSSRQRAGSDGAPLPDVLNNGVVSALTAERSRLEAQLEQLRARLGEQNPQVIELAANVAQLTERIASEGRRVTGSVATMNQVNRSRLAQARAAVDEQRAKLLKIKSERDQGTVLTGDVENAQKAYDAIALRANQTRMESQNTQTNVSVLKRASPPPFPSSPNMVLNAAGGVLLALLAGAMTAMVRELRDRRLRTDDDVRLGLNQPLLGVLPLRKSVRKESSLRRRITGPRPALPLRLAATFFRANPQ
jgi:succinoglycan biosynthesis transport protein ExoP